MVNQNPKSKIEEILEKFRNKSVGIFVDEANLFYSQKKSGWHIHWQKVLELFQDFSEIKIARYYMGMPLEKNAYEKNILIKDRLKKEGFDVITKPLKKIYLDRNKKGFIYKCNFDVEITRDVIKNFDKVDLILLFSSDSDFIGLRDDAIFQQKGFIFVCFENNAAWEIRRSYHIFFEDIREKVEFIK